MDYFDYLESSEDDWTEDFDIEEFLEKSQEQEKQRLQKELNRIDQQLEERGELHDEALDELESKLEWYIERLETLQARNMGNTGERDHLKQKIEEFYQQIRKENRQEWMDRQELERERREVLSELEELDIDDVPMDLI